MEWNWPASSTISRHYDHKEENTYSYQALIPSWNEADYWMGPAG